MCGIAGFTRNKRTNDLGRIEKLTTAMIHRGPDQQGTHLSDLIALAAVRLSIIDLGGGDQPIYSDDRDSVIVFNGEIYNHAELREELEQLGHRFRSHCDTEVVLRAFLQWDVDSFRRLRGMFAAAIWTESERRLVLVRDRMGIKPLYLCQRGSDLYFGSEMRLLFQHPEIERRLDLDALGLYLTRNYVPSPYTLVQGIRKLTAGHWLEWRAGEVRQEAYWKLRFRPDSSQTLESAKEELDGLMRESVREHLVSDVPLGVWASGGLDSSAILHYAAESAGRQLKTFSVSFLGRSFDESQYFRKVASHYGTDHHELDLTTNLDIESAIRQMICHIDGPSADAGAVPVWFLSEMTRKHVTVALSGEGADELFAGYNTYLADHYARTARLLPAALRRWIRAGLGYWPVSDDKISLEYKLKRFLRGSLMKEEDAHVFWNGTFSAADKDNLLQPQARRPLPMLPFDRTLGPLNRFLHFDQLYYLQDDILNKCDRMSMAHSLEVRPAFLDHRIVEFAARLPENLKRRGSTLKFVLRELMRNKLPQAVLTRKKEGFDIPAHEWLRGSLRPLLLDTLSREAVEATGVFRWEGVQAAVRNHLERHANLGYHLWGLLILLLWMKQWNIQGAAPVTDHRRVRAVSSAT